MIEIQEQKMDEVAVIGLRGRLDASTSNDFQVRLLEIIDRGEKLMALDFAQLDYISSAGLRAILIALKKIKSADGQLVLYALKNQIKEIFEISGFTSMIPIFETQEKALSNIRKG
ncbi:MAG TPA: STAS domain-containing protein [archaeon]|nr:STAS domain-containing protein [archaeon]